MALLGVAGCSGTQNAGTGAGSADASATAGAHMAGAAVDVKVTQEALDSKPKPWVLTTPEAAVRSYLAWTSYGYRIAQSKVAVPTMGSGEEVRVDSYVQYNIQKNRLIDQTLESIEFGKPAVKASRALLPAKEKWTYRYVSLTEAGETIDGPYSASYDTTYTVVKSNKGVWVVDSVAAKPIGEVK